MDRKENLDGFRKLPEELVCEKCGNKEFTGKYWETPWYEEAVYLYCTKCKEELILMQE